MVISLLFLEAESGGRMSDGLEADREAVREDKGAGCNQRPCR